MFPKNKHYFKRNVVIFCSVILFNLVHVNAQISRVDVISDIESLIYAGDYWVMQSESKQNIMSKMRDNPDPYISYIRENLYLPEDKETLSVSEDTLIYYRGLIGILFVIGNEDAHNIIMEEYNKQISILEIFDEEINIHGESLSDNEFSIWFKSIQNITSVLISTMNKFAHYKNNSIVLNCLSQFDKRNDIFGYNALNYFEEVALENPTVISRLVEIYSNPESSWFHHNTLEASIKKLWGDLSYSEMIDELISYIEKSFLNNSINHRGIANSLTQKLEHARRQLQKNKIKQAANQLNAFLNELEAQKEKHVIEQAYDLLKYNAIYLIARLEE